MKHFTTYTLSEIFATFSPEELQFLQSHTTILKLKRNQPLFLAGDKPTALYAVASGCLKNVRETQAGQSIITRIVGPGKIVGLRELFVEFVYHRTCISLEDTTVFAINQNAIIALIKKNTNVGFHFIRLFSSELTRIENMLESLLNKSSKKRLASIMYDFFLMFAKTGSKTFVSPLQRKDIAELAGMTPETVSRALHEFKKSKILQTQGKYFIVLDAEALKNYED